MILRALSMTPHSLLLRAGSYVLAFLIGMGVGNYDATKRALNRQLTEERAASAARQAENHRILLAYQKDVETKLKQRAAVEKAADAAAYKVIQQGMEEAGKARETALRALENEKRLNNDLRTVNAMLADEMVKPDPGCVFTSGMRDAINGYVAASNSTVAARAAEAGTTGLSPSPNAPDSVPLTCDEVARRIVALIEHDANSMLRAVSEGAWSSKVAP